MKYNLVYHYWNCLFFSIFLKKVENKHKGLSIFIDIPLRSIFQGNKIASIDEETFFFTEDKYRGNYSIRKFP